MNRYSLHIAPRDLSVTPYLKDMLSIMGSLILGGVLIMGCSSTRPGKRSDLALKYLTQPQQSGPCLASLVGPPSSRGNCMPWVANVDAAPTYEPARRLVFTGAGDNFLHLLDADSGNLFAKIATIGRVITQVVFSADGTRMYFGTDQGVVAGYDAFSFERLFSFAADSRVNNDLMIVDHSLVFSTGLATVYCLDLANGQEQWHVDRPVTISRLKLASYSNIVPFRSTHSPEDEFSVAVPHPDGFVSLIGLRTGASSHHVIQLEKGRDKAFPDIVAPMLYIGGLLWVASYDFGIFWVDPISRQIRNHIKLTEVQQLAFDGERVFAASMNSLFSLSMAGGIIWQNNFSQLKTREARYGFPFGRFSSGRKRVFNGLPSRLLLSRGGLIMATSVGALAEFDPLSGEIRRVAGNSLGFGPKINSLGGRGIMAVTQRGLLAIF